MANVGQHGSSYRPTEQARREQGAGQRLPPESSPAGTIANVVTEKAKDLVSGAKDTVQEWGSAAAEAACQTKHKAQELASTAAHKAESFGEDMTNMIRRYPMQALLVGFGVGFLLAGAIAPYRELWAKSGL
jgi:ElaB/YqjD/DUF883 family membrane-anchored ribosome-binding protein